MNDLDKKISLATEILSLSIEISTNSIIDIFVDYSSHTKGMSIKVIKQGWTQNTSTEDYDLSKHFYLDTKSSLNELQEVLDYLKKLKEEL